MLHGRRADTGIPPPRLYSNTYELTWLFILILGNNIQEPLLRGDDATFYYLLWAARFAVIKISDLFNMI